MPSLPVQQRPADLLGNEEPMDLDIVEAEEQEELPVLDEVQVDLESLVAPYVGRVRVQRLEFIADHCKSLRPFALDLALKHTKETSKNVTDYVRLHQKLEEALQQLSFSPMQGLQELQRDAAWVDAETREMSLRQARLEGELKSLRSTCLRENLRCAQENLGHHFMGCGDLKSASAAFMQALALSTSSTNQMSQYLDLIRVNICLKRWTTVSTLRNEAANNAESQNPLVNNQLQCVAALYELNARHYKACAQHLLSTNFDNFEQSEANFLAPIDILTYSSLCALATFSRSELSRLLINSPSFKQFCELASQIKDIVHYFHESKYGLCLAILQDIKDTLMLDMYLAPHAERLLTTIKNRAIVQYFQPYSSACLRKMAKSFAGISLDQLEKELINLICEGHLKARIDSQHKILYAGQVETRNQIFERAIELGKKWQRQAHALISRTAILNSNLRVGKKGLFIGTN